MSIQINVSDPLPLITESLDDDTLLGNVKLSTFKTWLSLEVASSIKDVLGKEVEKLIKPLKEKLDKTAKSLTATKAQLTKTNNAVDEINSTVNDLKHENDILKETTSNLLKYIVNEDRNSRRKNVLIFGLTENDVTINNIPCSDDLQKTKTLLEYIGVDHKQQICEVFRLGAKNQNSDRTRPLKVCFTNSSITGKVLTKCKVLKNLDKLKIYIKPDKSLKERQEFDRLNTKKNKLLLQYPAEGNNPRVTLSRGSLKVDGVEVDNYKSPQSIF